MVRGLFVRMVGFDDGNEARSRSALAATSQTGDPESAAGYNRGVRLMAGAGGYEELERAQLKVEWLEMSLRKIKKGCPNSTAADFADSALTVAASIDDGPESVLDAIVKAIGG